MPGLFQRAFGGGATGLEADLRNVTESGVIEVPKDLLLAVSQASHNEEDRRQIMRHLRECLAEPSATRWRRVYAGLLLVEDLLKRGSQELMSETAEGHHFDLVQRLSLLEHFECTTDRRVQGMVRAKASALRADIVPRLQTAHDGSAGEAGQAKDCVSTCSPGAALSSCSTASTSVSNTTLPSGAPWKPEGQMVLNGIVAVGHTDDTTSESSADEARKAVRFREKARKGRKAPAKSRRSQRDDDSSDADDEPKGRQERSAGAATGSQKAPPPAPPPAATVDLLDL